MEIEKRLDHKNLKNPFPLPYNNFLISILFNESLGSFLTVTAMHSLDQSINKDSGMTVKHFLDSLYQLQEETIDKGKRDNKFWNDIFIRTSTGNLQIYGLWTITEGTAFKVALFIDQVKGKETRETESVQEKIGQKAVMSLISIRS